MTVFDRKRQQLRDAQDKEIQKLDEVRESIGDSSYWESVSNIYRKYSDLLVEIDSAERNKIALTAAKENTTIHKRPESTYADILGQLKAQKESELLLKLSQLDSNNVEKVTNAAVDMKDPFYLDKKDPLSVFENWWNEFVQQLPSVDEVRNFLKKIDISEFGAIYIKESKNFCKTENHNMPVEDVDTSLLKTDMFQSARIRNSKKRAEKSRISRLRSPLLHNKSSKSSNTSNIESLCHVVDSYGLPESTCDLLYEHIEKCCIPKGLTHVDKYTNMLEQFLRNVPENNRNTTISLAISRGWRELYYVN